MRTLVCLFLVCAQLQGQSYFTEKYKPFDDAIDSPETFLGYEIGSQHTRHDQIVAYLAYLATASNKAQISYYGKTHEGRKLPILAISKQEHLKMKSIEYLSLLMTSLYPRGIRVAELSYNLIVLSLDLHLLG
jgi:hypothetical protein